ncbi:hypothetical protein K438DRAFT_1767086 [Mycena galopus ATCC 62051]|nr:hypothetical protein K438DRAFT_1767086 [Mycena galopus ATCC 62051]
MMHFPQELVDIVVDNLHDAISSLQSCALAARTFLPSARIHIFRKIEITPPKKRPEENSLPHGTPSATKCQKLLKLLTSTSHIAPLVDELCIVLMGSSSDADYPDDAPSSSYYGLYQKADSWIMTSRTLSLIIHALNLKRISLVDNTPPRGGSGLRWNKLPRHLKSALADVFSSPKLESVHLRGVSAESPRQILSLFSKATSLTELSLSRMGFTTRLDPGSWPETRLPQLRFLFVPGNLLGAYLVRTSSNLEHLRLAYSPMPGSQNSIETVFATASVHLRTIHFFLNTSTFGAIAREFFKCVAQDSRLESITFETDSFESEEEMKAHSWALLDAAIEPAVTHHLQLLRMVEIKRFVRRGSTPPIPFTEWSTFVRAALPSLERRGLLRVEQHEVPNNGVLHGFE